MNKFILRKLCNCHDGGVHWVFSFHADWCDYVISEKRLVIKPIGLMSLEPDDLVESELSNDELSDELDDSQA